MPFYFQTPDQKLWTERQVSLTFDDGPANNTEALSAYLKYKAISATFFVIGENVLSKENVIANLVRDGHSIGNHTDKHNNSYSISEEALIDDIGRNDKLLDEFLPPTKRLFRAPYGWWDEGMDARILSRFPNYRQENTGWHAWAKDWADEYGKRLTCSESMAEIFESQSKRCGSATFRGIILLHDHSDNRILELTKMVVEHFESEGFSFVPLADLI